MTTFQLTTQPQAVSVPTLTVHISNKGRQSMPISDLLYLQSDANYTWLVWKDGQRLFMARTIKYYEARLPKGWFVRLHRNCLVNKAHITRLEETHQGLEVRLSNGTVIPVSRRRRASLKQTLASIKVILTGATLLAFVATSSAQNTAIGGPGNTANVQQVGIGNGSVSTPRDSNFILETVSNVYSTMISSTAREAGLPPRSFWFSSGTRP